MTDDPRLEEAFNLIRAVVAEADQRARDDILKQLTGNAAGGLISHTIAGSGAMPASRSSRRAPHGSAEALIDRALAEAGSSGLTVLGIQDKAETEFEKMVSTSAVRNWLRECANKSSPKYRQIGGVWYLASHFPNIKAVG